jgi:membrane-associated phospholipid phosphatase
MPVRLKASRMRMGARIRTLRITNLGTSALAAGGMAARFRPPMNRAMHLSRLLLPLLLMAVSGAAQAGSVDTKPLTSTEKHIETLGTGVAIALPLTAAGITLFKHDTIGSAQLVVETIMTVVTAYALKNIVHEERPNGADNQSFPSGTTALAASGSSFLWGRYGWEYGLPAFAATQLVSYSRIQAREHHWYDTLASSGIAAGYGYVLTTPFKKRFGVDTSLSASPHGAFVNFAYAF